MYNRKEMKKIQLNQIGKYMMMGEPVYMVKMDGSLIEIKGASDMERIFFHNLTGGAFAVYRKKFDGIAIGNFSKSFKIGCFTITIGYEKKGDDEDVSDAR